MSFMDSVSHTFNKGAASVERSGKKAQLKFQLGDLNRQRQDKAAQLGASLYEELKNNPQFRAGREQLFDAIAAIDAERANLQNQLNELDAQREANTTYRCQQCGSTVLASDSFCAGCGKPVQQIVGEYAAQAQQSQADASGVFCTNCGAPIAQGDAFCSNCGTPVAQGVVSFGQPPMTAQNMQNVQNTQGAQPQNVQPQPQQVQSQPQQAAPQPQPANEEDANTDN